MADKEVEYKGKSYGESSKVTLKISTLIWVIGSLISIITTLATMGYFDIKGDVKEQKSMFDKEKLEYREEVKEIIKEELRYEREKREKMGEDIGEMKGDIKVILEKTRHLENGSRNVTHSDGPDNSVPIPQH